MDHEQATERISIEVLEEILKRGDYYWFASYMSLYSNQDMLADYKGTLIFYINNGMFHEADRLFNEIKHVIINNIEKPQIRDLRIEIENQTLGGEA